MKKNKKSRRYKGVDRTNYGQYKPNQVFAIERVFYILLSLLVIYIGVTGLMRNDLYIRVNYRPGVHFTDKAAIVMFFSMFCLVANLISIVVDHYDRRWNERYYKVFRKWTKYLGYSAFVIAFIVQICQDKNITGK